MESAIIAVPAFSHACNTKQWRPLDLKQQIFCLSKVRKTHGAYRKKNLASMRVRCENREDGRMEMDRRRLLLSSSALGVLGVTSGEAKSEPYPAPDLSTCVFPTDLPDGAMAEGGCCPPFTPGTTAVDFVLPTSLPMRTRRAAHLLDEKYIEKYDKALKKMKELPAEDPRSFEQQAKVHCAYCNGSYKLGTNYMQVHKTWFFAPYHRWYLYFYERILADLIGDDSFALPFWNWDAEVGMSIPAVYTNSSLALYSKNRDACHQPPKLLNIENPTSCDTGVAKSNYANIYSNMKSSAETAELFHGGAYRYNDESSETRVGTLESSPHNYVHTWTGSPNNVNREDMGSLYSSGRDPLFYSHHCNVDRMWIIWNDILGYTNYTDTDLLETKFLFYDEKKQLVQVKAGDCYDYRKLRYQYQEVPIPWLEGRALKKAGKLIPKPDISSFKQPTDKQKKLTSSVTVPVERPNKKLRKQQVEVLCIEGLEMDRREFSKFNIFINYPEASSRTPFNNPHYAGSFTNFGVGFIKGDSMKSMTYKENFKIGISETLEDLGVEDDDKILVTIVPEAPEDLPKTPITFTSIKILYITK